MKMSNKTIVIIAVVWCTTVVGLIITYALSIAPLQKLAEQKHLEFVERAIALDYAVQILKEKSLTASIEKLSAIYEKFGQFVRNCEESHDFALEVNQIAKDIDILDMETQRSTTDMCLSIPNCPNITISKMDIAGTVNYEQFTHLINTLERYRPMILIHSFDLETLAHSFDLETDESNYGDMKMNMNIRMIVEGKSLQKNREKLQMALKDIELHQ